MVKILSCFESANEWFTIATAEVFDGKILLLFLPHEY
jgi:hypothetical protein